MIIFKLSQPAPEGSKFQPDAFAGNIGKSIPFGNGTADVIDAEVVDDGAAVVLTLRIPGEHNPI